MEDVVEEPLEVDMLRGRHAEFVGDGVGHTCKEGMGTISLEHHEIMVCERHTWRRLSGTGMINRRIRHPRLPRILEMELHATPFIPLKGTVPRKQQQDEQDENDGANLGCFEQVAAEIIDDGGVQLSAEGKRVLFWDGEDARVEGEACKSIVDVGFQSFEGRVKAVRGSLDKLSRRRRGGRTEHRLYPSNQRQ